MVKVSDRDIECARSLPDQFVGEQLRLWDDARNRIEEIVQQCWATYGGAARQNLADELVPILEELINPDHAPTDKHRNACERAVTGWLIRYAG